jgi:hypothetical protein
MTDDELEDVLQLLDHGATNAENFAELTDNSIEAAVMSGQASGLRRAAVLLRDVGSVPKL